MDIDNDIARLALQERRLILPGFDLNDAWTLGGRIRAMALARGLALVTEVRLASNTVFLSAMTGTAPANADWARRKRNTTELLGHSSYRVGLELKRSGATLQDSMGLPARDYASHGGSFPLLVGGVGCVGSVTVSGAPQRVDHEVVTRALAEILSIDPAELALAEG